MKNKILLISALLLAMVSITMANSRSDAENQCRSVCSDQRSACRDVCYNDHKDDMTYIGMNQCRDKCNPISNKCKEACVPTEQSSN